MKYPSGIKQKKTTSNHTTHYDNRGMTLEKDLNMSNQYYVEIEKAYIYKKPTPIQITKVDYPSRSKAIIKEAFFQEPSTTDYNGLYKGKYIDFEAKETNNKTSFPLNNIHPHQIKHIENVHKNGAICFLVVRFNKLNTTYILMANDFLNFIKNYNRKSIPITYFEEFGHIIEEKYIPRLDYLKVIDKVLGGV